MRQLSLEITAQGDWRAGRQTPKRHPFVGQHVTGLIQYIGCSRTFGAFRRFRPIQFSLFLANSIPDAVLIPC